MAAEKVVVAAGLGLIFDLDGVIVDSMPLHEQAWRRYLGSLEIDATELPAGMHGRRNDEIFRDLLGPETDLQTLLAHGEAKEREFRGLLDGRLAEHLVPGVADLLDRISGAPIALATNAERANVDFVLDGSGFEGSTLRRYFGVIVDGSQVARPKPAPDVYLRAAELLGILPQNCIVFEDSPVGVAAARSAEMRVVGVLTHGSPLGGVLFAVANFLDPGLDSWLAAQRTA